MRRRPSPARGCTVAAGWGSGRRWNRRRTRARRSSEGRSSPAIASHTASNPSSWAAIGHFGAIEGLDDYAGRNIAVVGTLHMREETYHLLAHAPGRTDRGMEPLAYRRVEHDGMEFRFMTYGDDLLRIVQLHLIESELEQAVGRARGLTEDYTVRVYSNLPLRRAEHEV